MSKCPYSKNIYCELSGFRQAILACKSCPFYAAGNVMRLNLRTKSVPVRF